MGLHPHSICARGHPKRLGKQCYRCKRLFEISHRKKQSELVSDYYVKEQLRWHDAPPWIIELKRAQIILGRAPGMKNWQARRHHTA